MMMVSWHVIIALFLLSTNPVVHTIITEPSPCVPYFLSSSFFECTKVDDNIPNFMEKIPFLLFELYTITMFLYICCFLWTFIVLGLAEVHLHLEKITMEISKYEGKTHHHFLLAIRKLEVVMQCLNDTFYYFLMSFPSILLLIVAMLIFGTIRLWHVDPKTNLMFPLCGMRCGFEALTPLQMAGKVNRTSSQSLREWAEAANYTIRKHKLGPRMRKLVSMERRACHPIRCTAGSLYTFENSIVLCSLNNCLILTLNLLVSFR